MVQDIVRYFNNYREETLRECEEWYEKYKDILINKSKYTSEECDLWMEFMGKLPQNWLFPYYTIQRVCETLMEFYKKNDKAVRLGGTPNNVIILPTHDFCGEQHHLSHGCETGAFGRTKWSMEIFGIDVVTWEILLNDIDNPDRVIRESLHGCSFVAITGLLADLRQIPTDKVVTRYVH